MVGDHCLSVTFNDCIMCYLPVIGVVPARSADSLGLRLFGPVVIHTSRWPRESLGLALHSSLTELLAPIGGGLKAGIGVAPRQFRTAARLHPHSPAESVPSGTRTHEFTAQPIEHVKCIAQQDRPVQPEIARRN